jgi:hypothetical protein
MDISIVYAIAAGGIFACLIFVRFLAHLERLTSSVSVWIAKHLTYPYLLGRRRFCGPWTRFRFLAYVLHVTVTVLCLCIPNWSVLEAGRRAGTLALVNMMFLFAGIHLSFIADLLGVYLQTCQALHRAAGWMMAVFCVIHAVLMSSQESFSLHDPGNLFALIVYFLAILTFSRV